MSTRLHALGFASEWTPELLCLIEGLAQSKTKLVGAARGNYRVWRSQQGAELWFHYPRRAAAPARSGAGSTAATAGERPVAVTPFHRGLSKCPIKIGRYLSADRVNPLEGSCMAWLPAQAGGGPEQVVVVELAPYGLHVLRSPPYTTTAQIVCFAHAVWAFPDVASYSRQTPGNRRIHAGSIAPVTQADVPEVKLSYQQSPITLGLATGIVRRAIRHTNPETRAPYYWLLLETKRGAIDVLANPDAVEGDISEGHVAQVCGSLLARLAGTPA
jgi:hypothetical protein